MALATKKKPKKVKVSASPRAKKQVISWAGWEDMDGPTFHKHRRFAFDHYYSDYKTSDLVAYVYDWMKQNEYTKEQIECAKARGSSGMTTAAIIARCLSDGMPDYSKAHDEWWQTLAGTQGTVKPVSESLRKYVDEAVRLGKPVKEEKVEAEEQKETGPVITIQDRMRDAAARMCEEIDEIVDQLADDPVNFDVKNIKVLNLLKGKEAKAAHSRIIKSFYESQKSDYEALLNLPSASEFKNMSEHEQDLVEQLKEGYAHLEKKSIKKIYDFYMEIEAACDMLAQEQKVTRKPRAKKTVAKDKLVAKLKYKKTDEPLKLVSVNPVDVVGANELWVYNTKTRKIGKYIASSIDPTGQGRPGSGLSVKGTTITGFDENASVQKTLRKPDEQLSAFKNAGKVALRKFLDDIKAVDIKLNGRINEDTILLKVS